MVQLFLVPMLSTRRRLRLTVFMVAMLAICMSTLAPAGLGTAEAQEADYSLSAIVDEVAGDEVTISIQVDPRDVLLGALEGSLVFDPEAVTPTSCDFRGDLGACNPLDDRLRFSGLFLDGLSEPSVLLTVTFATLDENTSTTVEFDEISGVDAGTAELVASTAPTSFTTGEGSSNPLVIALPVIAVVVLGGFAFLRSRSRKS